MLKTVSQFIPIIIIFLLVSHFISMAHFSNTILGKTIAVLIIIFYTFLDKMVGTVVCLLVIFYYQTDIVENMLNMDTEADVDADVDVDTDVDVEPNDEISEHILVDDLLLQNDEDQTDKKMKNKKEGLMNYSDLYKTQDILLNNEKLQGEFRNKNCVKGELLNKDVNVNYEMAEHVFPEIKFRKGFCNPCLNDCDFSIIEQKLNAEDNVVRKVTK